MTVFDRKSLRASTTQLSQTPACIRGPDGIQGFTVII